MPAPIVKSVSAAAEKWQRRAGSASDEYSRGVQSSQADWAAATSAAKDAWKAGLTEAQGRGAFEKGVVAAGNARWKEMSTKKGPSRFAEGVAVGQSDYQQGVGPYLELIARTDLPPRGATGAEGNYQRVATIGKALRALKTGRR
jgi:hypothetical protein